MQVFHWSLALLGMILTFGMTWVVDVRFAGASWFAFVILLVVFFFFRSAAACLLSAVCLL